jgi:inner membrane protease ATP23
MFNVNFDASCRSLKENTIYEASVLPSKLSHSFAYALSLYSAANTYRYTRKGKISKFAGHGAECAKRRATLSVEANPKCRDKAREYVDAAFERCYKDTFPFDRHPNLR